MSIVHRCALLSLACALGLLAAGAGAQPVPLPGSEYTPLPGPGPELTPVPPEGPVCEPRPTPECRKACQVEVRRVRNACRKSGESRRECSARARAHRIACREARCHPAPSCEDRCRRKSAELLRSCLADGGGAEPCQRDADEARRACVGSQCRCSGAGCLAVYDPVCGDDGMTYNNGCHAWCAGAEVVRRGACPPPDCRPVICLIACEHGFVRDDEGCEICACADPPFLPIPLPPLPPVPPGGNLPIELPPERFPEPSCPCPAVFKRVCGSDGRTYGNVCHAQCAGVPVAHEGPCEGDDAR